MKANLGPAFWPILHLMLPFLVHCIGMVIAWPAVADTVVEALCTTDKCPEAIYLSGLQHTISGFVTMFTTPWLGAVSDIQGRKPFITLCFFSTALPLAVLAYSQSRTAVYVYWVVKTISAVVGEGTTMTLILAYVADVVHPSHRAATFGYLMSCMSVGLLVGVSLARILPSYAIFKVATVVCSVPVLYCLFLLPETLPGFKVVPRSEPWQSCEEDPKEPRDPHGGPTLLRRSTLKDSVALIRKSRLLLMVVCIAFLSAFAESGLVGSLLYYLKGLLHFGKNEFAELFLVMGASSLLSQLVLLPLSVWLFGVRFALVVGVFFGVIHCLLYGIAWTKWVPYVGAAVTSFIMFIIPSTGAIVSEHGSADDQGKLQGLLTAVRSLAAALAPLLVNPLIALFFSTKAPFDCPGFAFYLLAGIQFCGFLMALCLPSSASQGGAHVQLASQEDQDPLPELAEPPRRIDPLHVAAAEAGAVHNIT